MYTVHTSNAILFNFLTNPNNFILLEIPNYQEIDSGFQVKGFPSDIGPTVGEHSV